MFKNFVIASTAAVLMASPALAANKTVPLGDINPGTAKTAQIPHFARGPVNGFTPQGVPQETYASSAKAFLDTVLFNITPVESAGTNVGMGSGFFTFQVLTQSGQILKNITNGALSLLNLDTNETVFSGSLVQAEQFSIPFTTGRYQASISGNASGRNGGDYQVTFASPVAPVPEPAVVGSMAAGLALAGFVATRRRRKVANAA